MDSDESKASSEDVFNALFPIEKSIRYHQRRRRFYDSWHRWFMLVVILAGSATVTDFFAHSQVYLGLLIAIVATSDIVFGLSDKARDHEFLMRRFCHLTAKIRRCSLPTLQDIESWKVERVEIETDEPAIYWALEAACYNEAARALDRNREDEVYLAWHYRLLKNLFQFDPTRFPTMRERAALRGPKGIAIA